MCKVTSIINQKGGVGKTTTTINLGMSLTNLGKKVLLIDLDPQSNLTMSLGYPQPDDIEDTIATLLYKEIDGKSRITQTTKTIIKSKHGFDFIPANIELAGLENILINTMNRENILKRIIKNLTSYYDYILIDTLPSLNILTINALNASDNVIIPVQAQYLSAKGVELLLSTIVKVRNNLNPKLSVSGVLITMLDKRANFQKDVIGILEKSFGRFIKIFDTKIPLSVKVSEMQSQGLTIFSEKNNKVAEGYSSLAKELLKNERHI